MPTPTGYDAYGNPIYDDNNSGYGQPQGAGASMFGAPQNAGPSMYPTVRKNVPNTGYGSTNFAAGVPMYGTQSGPNGLTLLGNWWNDYNANFRGRQIADPYGANPLPTAYQPAPFPNFPNYMGSQANPLGVQQILPTAQAGQGAINAQSGAGNPFAGMQNPRQNNTITPPNQKPVTEDNRGGLAANGGTGNTKGNTGAGANTGGGTGAKSNNPNVPPNAVDSGRGDKIWVDPRGAKHSDNDYVEMSYRLVDDQFRAGFTDAFIQQHGEDPLSFYKRAFANDPKYAGWETSNAEAAKQLNFRAADAAINDARFLPGAIAEWQQKHGNTPIPDEQWRTWWSIAQSTNGYGINGGVGVSQYGVY